VLLTLALSEGPLARAEPGPSPISAAARRPLRQRGSSATTHSDAGSARWDGAGSWWVGTAGVALALAVCGWASVAARKYVHKPGSHLPALRVVGRTSLSPRHTIYLLEAGDRVLLVGTGPQGAPSLLGELTDADALARLVPRSGPTPSEPVGRRPGDDR
jgi:hypothetical protein